jgi:hypothetical protein
MAMITLAQIPRNDLLQQVNETARRIHIEPNFDPIHATDQELKDRSLPLRPDPVAEPELYQFWTAMFSPPLTFQNGDLEFEADSNFATLGAVPMLPRQQSSRNWSGASITARDGRMLTDVLATWVVPWVTVPAGADPALEYKSSCWVGLDGQRSYADSTLPQLGTEQVINKGGLPSAPKASLWIQWWPQPVFTIPTLSVSAGDRVFCWLMAISYTSVVCIFKVANDPGPAQAWLMLAPTINFDPPPIAGYQAKISGATAQWITEACTNEATNEIYPLPNYTRVDFEGCQAISRPDPFGPGRHEQLLGPTRTSMYKVVNAPGQRVTISTGKRPGNLPGIDVVTTEYVP